MTGWRRVRGGDVARLTKVLSSSDRTSPGLVMDRYEIAGPLGSGAMGRVWKARDRDLDRWVAVKMLKEDASPTLVRRFLREARTAARLSHPNLVRIYDFGQFDNHPFLVMELIEGRPLGREGTLHLQVETLRKVALAVEEAHRNGIIHRDLKPGNILVDENNEPRVIDFGLAHLLDGEEALTRTGARIGTPQYMAPEQVMGSAGAIDERTDVYALGTILYEMLTGQSAFSGSHVEEMLAWIVSRDPIAPRSIVRQIPWELEAIVMRAMEKKPENRYATAAAFAADLGNFLAGRPIAARRWTWASHVSRAIRRHLRFLGVVGGLVAALAAILYSSVSKRWEAGEWVSHARAHMEAGEFERARVKLDQARARIPVDEEMYARCLAELSERRRAAEEMLAEKQVFDEIRRRIDDLPVNAEGRKRAVQLLGEGLSRYGRSLDGWMRKGRFHEELGEYDAAEEAYLRAVELKPEAALPRLKLGLLQARIQHRFGEAVENLNKALERNPDLEDAVLAQAFIALCRKKYRRALELCDRVMETGKHRSRLSYILGHIFSDPTRGYFNAPRAERHLNEGLKLDPSAADLYNTRGMLYVLQQKPEKALRDFDRALALAPGFFNARNNRGVALHRLGRFQEALEELQATLFLAPNTPMSWYNLGCVQLSMREFEEAILSFNKALELRPDGILAIKHRALAYEELGSYERALADYDRWVKREPRTSLAWLGRGRVREKLGKFGGAKRDYQRALTLGPTNRGEARRGLRRCATMLAEKH